MKIKILIYYLFIIIILASAVYIMSQKLSTYNDTKIAKSEPTSPITEQKLPLYNEAEPLKINNTFETWSRGYWSNLSYKQPYFRVITNYSEWTAFLDEHGVGVEGKLTLEGTLFPGVSISPKIITPADFNNYFIVTAMMGVKNYAEGPEIEIKNISRTNDAINVTVRMYDPRGGAAVVSAPYHIIIVKRELMPMGNSTFIFVDTDGNRLGKVEIKE